MRTVYQNARVITGGAILPVSDVVAEDGVIRAVVSAQGTNGDRQIDLHGAYLSPGWIDLHCHGAAGFEFIDATAQAVKGAASFHAKNGTRVLYPTLSAYGIDELYHALEAIEQVKDECGLIIPGVHLEGPYLSPAMAGGQDVQFITKPKEADYTRLYERFGSLIARWTFAPEEDDGSFLAFLTAHGILPSMGHSAADGASVARAAENGCRLVTHLYSCTSTITRHEGFRRIGITESAYLRDDLFVEAIADGCHLPQELIALILKGIGRERTAFVTDAIRFAGMDSVAGMQGTDGVPYLIEDGVAKLADRSAFAGSIATTAQILRAMSRFGVPLADIVYMMTQTPARIMGLTGYGKIEPGYRACFTAFDEDLNILSEIS